MAVDFGRDLSGTDDLDENGLEVEGEELVAQAIYRRLVTARGQLVDDPNYGFGVYGKVQASMTQAQITEIGGLVRVELAKDETLEEIDVSVTQSGTNALEVKVAVMTGLGPFAFVFELTTDTVRRILEDV